MPMQTAQPANDVLGPERGIQQSEAVQLALKHQCVFDFDFRRELLSEAPLRHKTPIKKSSFLLTDGALAEWVASEELERWPGRLDGSGGGRK
jgi:hypothetical protein